MFLCLGLGEGLRCSVSEGLGLPSSVSEGLGLPSSIFEGLGLPSSCDFEGVGLVERALSELSLDSTRRGEEVCQILLMWCHGQVSLRLEECFDWAC